MLAAHKNMSPSSANSKDSATRLQHSFPFHDLHLQTAPKSTGPTTLSRCRGHTHTQRACITNSQHQEIFTGLSTLPRKRSGAWICNGLPVHYWIKLWGMGRGKYRQTKNTKEFGGRYASQVSRKGLGAIPGTSGMSRPDLCVISTDWTECPRDKRNNALQKWRWHAGFLHVYWFFSSQAQRCHSPEQLHGPGAQTPQNCCGDCWRNCRGNSGSALGQSSQQ